MKFSERMGMKPVRTELQVDTMDEPLRNGLWNALDIFIWDQSKERSGFLGLFIVAQRFRVIFKLLWDLHFDRTGFINFCNTILETEKSGYRFIGNQLAPITSETEISAISDAISGAEESGLQAVATHLKDALAKLSDRKEPDYRNSIKESISAVESVAWTLANKPKADLNEALTAIEKKIGLHGALKAGLLKLYGYTSDEGGVRHALLEMPNVDFDDAKFMLVSCSAFVNYLIAKCQKVGIKLD